MVIGPVLYNTGLMYLPDELRLDFIFGALAHPLRREMIDQLRRHEVSATAFRLGHEISQPAMSHHVRVLMRARLIRQRIVGPRRPCRLSSEGFRIAHDWLGVLVDAATPTSDWIRADIAWDIEDPDIEDADIEDPDRGDSDLDRDLDDRHRSEGASDLLGASRDWPPWPGWP